MPSRTVVPLTVVHARMLAGDIVASLGGAKGSGGTLSHDGYCAAVTAARSDLAVPWEESRLFLPE